MGPEPPAGKKKGSPLGLIAGIIVVLGIAGGGGWWYLNKDKNNGPPEVVQTAVPPATAPPTAPAPTTPAAENPPANPANPPTAAPTIPPTVDKSGDPKSTQKAASKSPDPKATAKTGPSVAEAKPAVPVPVPAAAPTRSVPVPDGTPFTVTLVDDIPADADEGLPLHFVASADLKAGGAVVIAKGAQVTGAIFEGKKKKAFGSSKMTMRMLQAITVDGRKVNIRATSGTRGDGPARRPVDVPGMKAKDLAAAKGSEYIAYIDGEVVVSVKQ